MSETIIIQRVLPHYRRPLFRALHQEFGWQVAIASNPPTHTFLDLDHEQEEYVRTFEFDFHEAGNQYRCKVPIEAILEDLKPRRIISEFSMRMDSWRTLPGVRRRGSIESFALWSHGWNMERGFDSIGALAAQAARLPALSRADLVLTYTQEGKRWVDRWLPWKQSIAIGNTLDTTAIADAALGCTSVRSGSPQFISVGRLTHDKNFVQLIDIFSVIQREFPDAALKIIGDGPARSSIEAHIKESGVSKVELLGAIYDEQDLAPHFKGADLFLMPGAAGLSVNHALAYDLPIVAFARGQGMPNHHPEIEYVVPGQSGLLCWTPSVSAYASLVSSALRSNEHLQLKATIPEFRNRKLKIERMIEAFRIVDELL